MQQARRNSLVGLFATLGAIAVACVLVESLTQADQENQPENPIELLSQNQVESQLGNKPKADPEANNDAGNVIASTKAPAPGDDSYDWTYWRDFWSFIPIRQPTVPNVKNKAWVRNPIDAFVLTRLEGGNIAPAPPADKLTWLRRVTFLLTGLPPTQVELEAFLEDEDQNAHERVVERLLASPHYGERMGRHWLDVVRYEQNRVRLKHQPKFRGELHYRDYVIRAFNEDKPYNRFIMEQIAGDLLEVIGDPDKDEKAKQRYFDQIIAPAFLSIGDWFDECTDPNKLRMDIVDDMVDTTGKVFMGLSLGCARCHDHPFDPIPTEDYYALGGIFKSTKIIGDFSEFWRDGRDRMTRQLVTKKIARRNAEHTAFANSIRKRIRRLKVDEYTVYRDPVRFLRIPWNRNEVEKKAYHDAAKLVPAPASITVEAEQFAGVDNLRITELSNERRSTTIIETQTPLNQWARYTFRLPKTGRYSIHLLIRSDRPTPLIVQAGRNPGRTVLEQPIEGTGGWGLGYGEWRTIGTYQMSAGPNALRLTTKVDPVTKTAIFPQLDKIQFVLESPKWEDDVSDISKKAKLNPEVLRHLVLFGIDGSPRYTDTNPPLSDRLIAARSQMEVALASRSAEPAVLAVTEKPTQLIANIPVHIRGDIYNTRKEPTPRGMLRLFDNTLIKPNMPDDESGRLQLAVWLTSPKHPLTARVMVNRIWQWHFGEGLVATPNDFGSRGAKPTHPALLDWLAAEFVKSGWSVKHVQKLICTSNTYRMSSDRKRKAESGMLANPKSDPALRSPLSAFPKQRLSVEAIYDAMLCSIGKVPRQSANSLDFNKSADRMMYVLTSNRSPKGMGVEIKKMFGVFDYQPAGVSLPKREQTSTAAQSLWLMNNPLPRYFAEQLAARVLQLKQITDGERLAKVYVLALGRFPSDAMTNATLDYVSASMNDGASREEAWTRVCLAVYSSSEFRYID